MSRRIRITQIIYRFDVEGGGGGIGRFVIELCRALDKHRFDVAICALGNTGQPLEQERISHLNLEGIKAFAATNWDDQHPYQSFIRATRSLKKHPSIHPSDILHSHSEFGDITTLLLKPWLYPKKIMRTVHYGYRYEWRKRPLRRIFLTNFLYPLLFDVEIGVSQTITDTMNKRPFAKLFRRKARCIYNAINLTRFTGVLNQPELKKSLLKIPAEALVVGSVGRLTEQKGYIYFLEMANEVLERFPQAYFVIIGDGELMPILKEYAKNRNLQDRVLFTGSRSDIEELLACMDLFVSSSLWEGLPTVLQESMASGIPIVATDIPGTRELVQDGQTGWLAPAANPEALAKAVCTALGSVSQRERIVYKAKEMVQTFTIQAVTKQYETLYERLASKDELKSKS